MLQIDFRKQGDIYYLSTQVLIASAKTNRLCLSIKSVLSPTALLPLDIFKCGKKYTEMALNANVEDRTKIHFKD